MGGQVTLAFPDFGLGKGLKNGVVIPMLNVLGGSTFDTKLLTQDPKTVFPAAWTGITGVATSVVQPVAITILAFLACVELISVSSHIEADGMMGVRMVISSLLKILVAWGVTENAAGLGEALIDWVSRLLRGLQTRKWDVTGTARKNLGDLLEKQGGLSDDLGQNIGLMLALALPWLVAEAASVLVTVILYLRIIEIYVYTTVSGLGVAFLSEQHTRQWGISYIRSFAAVVFKSFTLYVGLYLYKLALTDVLNLKSFNSSHQLGVGDVGVSFFLGGALLIGVLMVSQRSAKALFGA